ncbi:ABC transporter permease [Acrocarpospora macrocephala]|uniref:ABC transporter permease n=1 Tax=Acrocarpospora macrocephala TaxID=150177 RepID=UPI0014781CD0|nr:ABC transporter permease [Acrocarpospora macrocephala]
MLIVVFSILAPQTFATFGNATTILSTQSVLALLALSALCTLVVGQFDLSLGAQLGLAQVILPGVLSRQEVDLVVGILVAVACTTLVGLLNGLLVAKLKLDSFIVTLGVATILSAVVLWYTDSQTIFQNVPASLVEISTTELWGIPMPIIYLAILTVIVWLVLERTAFGRRMEAVGGSQNAARLSGIDTDRVTVIAFMMGGALAGMAGVLQSSQVGSGNPALGPEFLLPAFAAAFLGATSFRVGRFNVWGTIIAVLTVATGVAGLNLLGVPQWVNPLFNGTALLVAVTATRFLRGAGTTT